MWWYVTHDEEGHEQDLKVHMLKIKTCLIVQMVVFVTQPQMRLKHLITCITNGIACSWVNHYRNNIDNF